MGLFRKLVVAGGFSLAPAACFANNLLDIYLQAKDQDQTYQTALHQRDVALEARPSAWSALLPQIDASADVSGNRLHVLSSNQSGDSSINNGGTGTNGTPAPATTRSIDHYTNEGYTLTLQQTLFDWSAFQALAQASRQVAEAEATLRSAQHKLITRVAGAYFDVLNARDALRVDLASKDGYNEQLVQGQTKYKAGLVAITDVRNAQASYDSSNASVIADRIALNAAVRALGVIVGQPVLSIADLRPNIPLETPDPASVTSWTVAAGQNNPDLLSSYYAAEVARKQIAIGQSKYLPTINANGSVGRDNSNSQYGDDVITDAVGVSLNWNIYAGGAVASQIRTARANYEVAQSQYELQRRTVDETTRNDYQQVVDGIAAINANRLAVISNQASVVATKVGLKVGTRTETDVLVATQSLSAAQKAYYQSRYNYLIAVLNLKQDAGFLSDKDLADIDRLFLPATTPALEAGPAQALTGVSTETEDESAAMSNEIEAAPLPPEAMANAMSPNELPPAPADAPPAENGADLRRALSIVPIQGSLPEQTPAQPATVTGNSKTVAITTPTDGAKTDLPAAAPAPVLPKGSCTPSSISWKIGGKSCSGPTSAAANGETVVVSNTADSQPGSASFTCRDGQFQNPQKVSCGGAGAATPKKAAAAPPQQKNCPAFTLHGTYANGESEIDGRSCYANFPPEPVGVIEKLVCTSPGLVPRINYSSCNAGGVQGAVTHRQ